MNTQRKIQLVRIGNIVFAWTLVGIFITLYDHFLLKSNLSTGQDPIYSLYASLFFNVFAGSFGGLLAGIVLTIVVGRRFRGMPYMYSLVVVVLAFIGIVSLISLLTAGLPTLVLYEQPFSNPEAKAFFSQWLFTTFHLKNILFWAVVVAITQFSLQVSDKFGPGNLWRILTGKYHMPIQEERIFMFLDLRSSTTIAEKLGEENYHEFLKEVFADITDPILNHRAEIYQYVGDEVVISWELNNSNDPNDCLLCFYAIQRKLSSRKDHYQGKYNTFPQFKAGAHFGKVIAGEIGIIKRDITYSGDVLNTTARIQSQCNALESIFLISKSLQIFIDPYENKWKMLSKGFIPLKGKENELELISIQQ